MDKATTNAHLKKIAEFTRQHLHKEYSQHSQRQELDRLLFGFNYRWPHTLRVTNYGLEIARAEKADIEVVLAACLLHDIAWFSPGVDVEHGRQGAKIARPLLQELGYNPAQVDDICYAIAVHVDGKADFAHPETLESEVVSDADNVDRFGAYRILQRCADTIDDIGKLAQDFKKRLEVLERYRHKENPLETATGRAMLERQLELQIVFFRQLVNEGQLSKLVEL